MAQHYNKPHHILQFFRYQQLQHNFHSLKVNDEVLGNKLASLLSSYWKTQVGLPALFLKSTLNSFVPFLLLFNHYCLPLFSFNNF